MTVGAASPPDLPGDFDSDGDVDVADLLTWQRALGANDPASDANNKGVVDVADYAIWRGHFGEVATAAQAAVNLPEPASAFPFLFGLMSMLGGFNDFRVRRPACHV